jgi:hypothetical protein
MIRILFILLMGTGMIACSKKDESVNLADSPPPASSELPASFVQRVLLETFTAAWCSTCPESDYKRDQVTAAYPGKVISISIHNNDSMALPAYIWYYATFGTAFPSGMVSRLPSLGNVVFNHNQWMSNTTAALNRTALCGLSISSSVAGNLISIQVKTGFIENYGDPVTLNVYLTEDSITGSGSGYSQANAFHNISGSPFYGQGNPIIGYVHNRVVRKLLTPNGGELIPSGNTMKNSIYTKTYSASLDGMNVARVFVVAFVARQGTSATTHEVLNVNQAKAGQTVSWN